MHDAAFKDISSQHHDPKILAEPGVRLKAHLVLLAFQTLQAYSQELPSEPFTLSCLEKAEPSCVPRSVVIFLCSSPSDQNHAKTFCSRHIGVP